MPTASNRPHSSSGKPGSPSGKSGADEASNETPVSSAENPAPAARKDGNTPSTRPARAAADTPSTFETQSEPQSANPGDHTNATGRDHPSQTEHAHRAFEKLNGESAKRVDKPMPGRGGPNTGKAGFDMKSLRKPSKMGPGIKGR